MSPQQRVEKAIKRGARRGIWTIVICILLFGFAAMFLLGEPSSEPTNYVGWAVATIPLAIAVVVFAIWVWPQRSFRASPFRKAWEQPGAVLWIYTSVHRRSIEGFAITNTENVIACTADKRFKLATRGEETELLLRALAERFPDAALGYSAEAEQAYKQELAR